jgi:hypothetical protein
MRIRTRNGGLRRYANGGSRLIKESEGKAEG